MRGISSARQLAYLQALGIEAWARRTEVLGPGPAGPPGEVPPEPAVPADASSAPVAPAPVETATVSRPAPCADLGWEALEARVRGCTACGLAATRTQTVFGVGDRGARWMLVGEAPGAEEDRQGFPFVGRAGQLLTAMLHAVGLSREQVYIANILKCRPPGNRDPRPEEVACCEGFLHRQVALVRPGIILALGRVAAQNLLKVDLPLKALRGRPHSFGPSGVPLIVTYHPAYLLRSPGEKRRAWEDLCFARRVQGELGERGID